MYAKNDFGRSLNGLSRLHLKQDLQIQRLMTKNNCITVKVAQHTRKCHLSNMLSQISP